VLQSMRSAAKYIWIFIFVAFVGGYLLVESSGLLGASRVTPTTPVATVNGEAILYQTWVTTYQNQIEAAGDQQGRALTLDEIERIKIESFDQLVADVLLRQELKKRRIVVTNAEIQQAAQYMPPPQLMQSADLQTEGQFDREKYLRLLRSPTARQSGLLVQLENYYRSEIPKQKLYEQLASDVYVTDTRLWQMYQDTHDTAMIAFVALRPEVIRDSVAVSDDEVKTYFERHKEQFRRPGRAVVSVIALPRTITAADTAAALERITALRREITSGAKTFADVARAESADSGSGAQGGLLGRGVRGRFVPEFENALFALRPGVVSEPVKTPFGFHLIQVDERKGDTLTSRHILVRIQQSEASAQRVDSRADSLLTALSKDTVTAAEFAAVAARFTLPVRRGTVLQGQPLEMDGTYIPSVGAWAFTAVPGERSEMFDADDAYYIARLDSLTEGGEPDLARVRGEVEELVRREKRVASLLPQGRALAAEAAATSLEATAQKHGLTVVRPRPFNRVSFVDGVGQLNEVIGAAFGLPVGAVSDAIAIPGGVYVIRVEQRTLASRAAWEATKEQQKAQLLQSMRQQRVQLFIANLRETAKIEDRRRELDAAARAVDDDF